MSRHARPPRWYHTMTYAQLAGRKVRTLCPINNGHTAIPAGSVLTICGKFNGLDLRSEPCVSCGVAVRIAQVNPEHVALIPEGEALE